MNKPVSGLKQDLRIAFVQDALPFVGGAERVLEAALEVFPGTPIYTLVYNPEKFKNTVFERQEIHTSLIDRLPRARHSYRNYLPLFPLAIEQFDLRAYDVILSFSYAVAHGVLPRPDQLHLSFMHTPLRYAWQYYFQYLDESGLRRSVMGWGMQILLHYLRLWDQAAASRVDYFAASSKWVADCIWRAYRRPAQVLYPPVETNNFSPHLPRENYFLTVSRLARHKKIDLIVEAFSRLALPLVVIGEGAEYKRLARMAGPSIKFLGWQPDEVVRHHMGRAKGFVHAAEEDFGITLVEAQAAGCPVIAYGKGGALETVISGTTGIFFFQQTPESLMEAVDQFEQRETSFNPQDLKRNVERFNKKRFKLELAQMVTREWEQFRCDPKDALIFDDERRNSPRVW